MRTRSKVHPPSLHYRLHPISARRNGAPRRKIPWDEIHTPLTAKVAAAHRAALRSASQTSVKPIKIDQVKPKRRVESGGQSPESRTESRPTLKGNGLSRFVRLGLHIVSTRRVGAPRNEDDDEDWSQGPVKPQSNPVKPKNRSGQTGGKGRAGQNSRHLLRCAPGCPAASFSIFNFEILTYSRFPLQLLCN
jgi:hypothetical protein